jgi:O-antigen/teichoic acid export membrane protein
MMVTAFSFLIMWTIDSFMIWRFTDLSSVWIYSVALSIATLVTLILVSINTIVAPQFSELYWKKDIKNLKKVVYYSSKLIFITTIPLLIILITYSKFFMWLYGSEFISWYTVLSILVIWQFISATCWSVWYFLNMTWKQKVFRNVILIALILNIILNYLLIPTYWILWAAIATSISISFWNIVSAIYIKIKFNILTFYIPFYNKIWK